MTGMDHPRSTTSPPRVSRRALAIGFAVVFTTFASVGLVNATAGAPAPTAPAPAPSTTTRHIPESLGEIRLQNAAGTRGQLIAALRAAGPDAFKKPAPPAPVPAPAPTPAPAPVVQPVATGGGYNDPSNPAAWDRIARCESGGNWATNTGNGYYGGIQFSLGSWQSVGGTGRPDQASRETQIAMGQRLYHSGGGWSHWPGCSRALGYR
jgi:Transglycosylase-like domain